MNFLRLANGNYKVKNAAFHLSSQVSEKMSVQSHHTRHSGEHHIWIDGGTNISTMGKSFKMLEYTGRFADMTGFANDLVKKDVPIGSGLTKCVDPETGLEFLL